MIPERLPEKLSQEVFDVIVIGGGITGSGIARDTAMRGLKTLLLEKKDFSSGTSSKSGKLIHGGLRYLKNFHLRLVFESVRERRLLLKVLAPHIVRPVRFVLPFYSWGRTPRWLAAIGLFLYDFLSLFSNVENFKFISKQKLAQEEPSLSPLQHGGLSYYDCACMDTRLTIDTLKSAEENGAALLNYCEVTWITYHQGRVEVEAVDRLKDKNFKFIAKSVVNAAGPWADVVNERSPIEQRFKLKTTCGVHAVVSRQLLPLASTITVEHPEDGRNLYLVPWGEHILIGTTDEFYDGNMDAIPCGKNSLNYLLNAVNRYFPNPGVKLSDIKSSFAGIRPLVGMETGQKEGQISRDYEVIEDPRGMLSITGGKLTSYRSMAEKAVDRLIELFFKDWDLKKCSTRSPITGGNLERLSKDKIPLQHTHPAFKLFVERYGSEAMGLLDRVLQDPDKGEVIASDLPYTWAEIDYFMEKEFARKLEDIVFRRTDMALFYPSETIKSCHELAAYMGRALNLDEATIKRECLEVIKQLGPQI